MGIDFIERYPYMCFFKVEGKPKLKIELAVDEDEARKKIEQRFSNVTEFKAKALGRERYI